MSEKKWKEHIWWSSWSVGMVLQIIAGFLRYNPDSLNVLRLVGWVIMIVGFVLGSMGVSTLKKMGGVPQEIKGRSYGVGTTVLVTSGI